MNVSQIKEYQYFAGGQWRSAENKKTFDVSRPYDRSIYARWHSRNLRMLRSVVGMGQVLFGSDYPYLRRDLAVSCRLEVETSAELDSKDSRAVLAGNAVKLFPRLADRLYSQDADALTRRKQSARA
jgi:hypothetical protein